MKHFRGEKSCAGRLSLHALDATLAPLLPAHGFVVAPESEDLEFLHSGQKQSHASAGFLGLHIEHAPPAGIAHVWIAFQFAETGGRNSSTARFVTYGRPAMLTVLSHPRLRHRQAVTLDTPICSQNLCRLMIGFSSRFEIDSLFICKRIHTPSLRQ